MRVHRVGICGTDISGYLGKMPFFSYPRIPGHELGVEVLEVGAGRDQRQAGRPLLGRAVHQLPELLRLPPRPHQLLREASDARRPLRRRAAAAVPGAGPQAARLAQAGLRAARPGRDAGDRLPRGQPGGAAGRRVVPDHRRRADRPGDAGVRQADRGQDHRPRRERAAARLLPQGHGRRAHGQAVRTRSRRTSAT